MFRFNVTSSMLSNKITSSQDYRVCSVTGHWQWLGHHADGQQLVSSLPALESACSRFCFVMAMDAGSSPETYLVLDQGFSLVSESLRKTLAVILKTDVRSVPSGGFNSRWSLFRSDSPACIYSKDYIFTVVWQWPGARTLIKACCLNDEGGFGSHLECCRALCWRSCILLLLAVSSKPQAFH